MATGEGDGGGKKEGMKERKGEYGMMAEDWKGRGRGGVGELKNSKSKK